MSQDSTQGLAPAANLATRPIEQEFHPGWTITIREHQPIELSDHTQPAYSALAKLVCSMPRSSQDEGLQTTAGRPDESALP